MILGAAGNRQVVIRDTVGGGGQNVTLNSHVLACDRSQTFWLSWARQWLYVGTGTKVGERTLLGLPLGSQPKVIKAISMATTNVHGARWSFPLVHGE